MMFMPCDPMLCSVTLCYVRPMVSCRNNHGMGVARWGTGVVGPQSENLKNSKLEIGK